MNEEKMKMYQKAVNRMKNQKILDPTSIIAELESEVDSYRTKLKKLELQKRIDDIQEAIGKLNPNPGRITAEDNDYLYVTSQYGTHKYSKLKLAMFWLTHSNDYFHETFGFSWVPSIELKELARKKINENSSIEIGIDISFSKDMQVNHEVPISEAIPETVLKDISSNLSPVDMVSHRYTSSTFHTK